MLASSAFLVGLWFPCFAAGTFCAEGAKCFAFLRQFVAAQAKAGVREEQAMRLNPSGFLAFGLGLMAVLGAW
jgi:hypothetical protein